MEINELKAKAYDLLVVRENIELQLRQVNDQIRELGKKQVEKQIDDKPKNLQ